MEVINICLLILVRCDFNEIHWFTCDGANIDFSDSYWDTVTVGINMCYGLDDLNSGYDIERGLFS